MALDYTGLYLPLFDKQSESSTDKQLIALLVFHLEKQIKTMRK